MRYIGLLGNRAPKYYIITKCKIPKKFFYTIIPNPFSLDSGMIDKYYKKKMWVLTALSRIKEFRIILSMLAIALAELTFAIILNANNAWV